MASRTATKALPATKRGPTREAKPNLNEHERVASMVAGGVLLAAGLVRRLPGGILAPIVGGALLYRGWTGWCALYHALGVNRADRLPEHGGVAARHGRKVTWNVHIERDARELYDFWRRFENLPRIMRHLVSVGSSIGSQSHWVARAPMGRIVEWDAEIITDRPGEVIAWRSLPGSQISTAGSVHFRKSSRNGTDVVVSLKYDPPGGGLVASLAEFLGHGVEAALDDDLRAFKRLMEAGETPTRAMRNRPHLN